MVNVEILIAILLMIILSWLCFFVMGIVGFIIVNTIKQMKDEDK